MQTPTTLQAALELARAGEDFVAEALTPKDRYALAAELGWPMDARTRNWCAGPELPRADRARGACGPDFEGMILDRQEEDELA